MKPINSCEVSMKVNGSSNREHRKFVFHCELLTSLWFKQERAARFKGQYRNARRDASLKCLGTQTRDIKPQVMVLPGHLDCDSAASRFGHLSSACQTSVRAFEGLNSERGSFFNNNHLTDLKASHFLRQAK